MTVQPSSVYRGDDRLLFGIILGVLAFWLFAQTTLNIAPAMAATLDVGANVINMAVSITALFSGIFIAVIDGLADRLGRVKIRHRKSASQHARPGDDRAAAGHATGLEPIQDDSVPGGLLRGVDGSARVRLVALAGAKARLVLLNVIESVLGEAGAAEMGHMRVSEYYGYLDEDALTRLKAAVPEQARLWSAPEERVGRGRSYREILTLAGDEGADLIVMGVQGKNALNRLFFGSTAHHVIREAHCPVLTIRV